MKPEEQIKLLNEKYKGLKYHSNFQNTFELLVATILSAQCTDERVDIVLKELRKKYKKPQDILDVPLTEFEQDIRSTGFYHNKTKNILGCCKLLIEKYNNKVPNSMEELLKFPGISRKTANVILQNGFGVVVGIACDTHVLRVSYRLGWSSTPTNDKKTEQELMKLFDKKYWTKIPNLLKAHGKAVCKAPTPECSKCFLNKVCPKNGVSKFK